MFELFVLSEISIKMQRKTTTTMTTKVQNRRENLHTAINAVPIAKLNVTHREVRKLFTQMETTHTGRPYPAN